MNRTALRRLAAPAAVALSLAMALAACGGNSSADSSGSSGGGKVSGTLSGAGSTAQQAAMQAWQAGFQGKNPDVTVNYDPIGSGGGVEQFLSGGAVFAGSDAYLTSDELKKSQSRCAGSGGAIDIPHYISPIALAFNLKGVKKLNLTPQDVAGIFSGKIKTWDDPALKKDNPGVKLPSTRVTAVHRSDDSGTTANFTDYLDKAAGSAWTYKSGETWEAPGGEGAQGTSGVVQAIKGGQGTIGYADASQVKGLGTAAVKVGGKFVPYTPQAAAKVVSVSKPVPNRPAGDLAIDVDRNTAQSGAYPIVLVSYHVVCKEYKSKSDADLVKAFMQYTGTPEAQQAAAKAAGSAPISDDLRTKVDASVNMIKAAG